MASTGISYRIVCSHGPRIVMSISPGFSPRPVVHVLLVELEQAEEVDEVRLHEAQAAQVGELVVAEAQPAQLGELAVDAVQIRAQIRRLRCGT